MGRGENLVGQVFGRLTVVKRNKKKRCHWFCQCKCGNITSVYVSNLKTGHTQSCGCFLRDQITFHGKHGSKEYLTWDAMIQRCRNPKSKAYFWYGARGITVCTRWLLFKNFYEDMGIKPYGLTIERIDNEQGYFPKNCKWATMKEQSQNKRPISCGIHKQIWFKGVNLQNNKNYTSNNRAKFARKHNLSSACIGLCIVGKQKSHKGWVFEGMK